MFRFFLETFINHINIVLFHLAYLLMGMLIIVFVNADTFHRFFFVIIVVLNFFATILNLCHIDMLSLTCIIFTTVAGTYN